MTMASFGNRQWLKAGYAVLLICSVVLFLYIAGFWGNVDEEFELVETLEIPSVEKLQYYSHRELASLYHRYINTVQVLCHKIVRIGSLGDGGWEICEDTEFRPISPCLVYSFGINNDFSFDDHIGERFHCEVHSFDPSMTVVEGKRNKPGNLWFHQTGLSDRVETLGNGWKVTTLQNWMKTLHHTQTKIDVLKIDVEKYEWQALDQIFSSGGVKNIRQLVIELHLAIVGEPERMEYMKGLSVLKKLYDNGFRIFYTHRNLWCKYLSREMSDIDEIGCHEVSFVYIPS